ncbi:unnamed protein product [Heligmosomoides polygyrus]|uniref:Methyltransf_21 domain-containing protein n=1 Tax=Heligmosomoides polygyrus TaxID=6339 RepID=A0A183FMW9_HELPZ|nr:unnamed protein product [Heligmosomoides polygyrus]
MRVTAARCALLALLSFTVLFGISRFLGMVLTSLEPAPSRVTKAFIDWQSCMSEQFEEQKDNPKGFFNNFAKMTQYCSSNSDISRIELVPIPNGDEVKYYILSKEIDEPSVVVSLGIGADIMAEQRLKTLLPAGSEFFGADPVVIPNADLYSKVGLFFPLAISEQAGRSDAQIRLDNGNYTKVQVVHIDAMTFFTKMVNRTFIDHVIMDNEGPEYELVPMIAIDDVLGQHKMAICHMNVEFHAPGPVERYARFVDVMSGVLRTGRFAAIHNQNSGHQRMFLVNYENPYCVHKYLEQFF